MAFIILLRELIEFFFHTFHIVSATYLALCLETVGFYISELALVVLMTISLQKSLECMKNFGNKMEFSSSDHSALPKKSKYEY